MKTNAKMMVIGLVLAMVFCYAGTALAETDIGTTTASARLNFRVTISDYIEFRIGTAGTTIDQIEFAPSLDDNQNNTEIAGTGGDQLNGSVTVRLLSNTGQPVTITAINPTSTGLSDGGTGLISYATILTTETGGGGLAPPMLTDAGGTTTALPTGVNDINTEWTYTYQNNGATPLPGTYTGQVTYTASAP